MNKQEIQNRIDICNFTSRGITVYPEMFHIDSKGRERHWWMESDGESYTPYSGLVDGKTNEGEPTKVFIKNQGKANETTLEEQILSEVSSKYMSKYDAGYRFNIKDIEKNETFYPMLAKPYSEDIIEKYWNGVDRVYIQPKLDGIRCIVTKDGAFSRSGKRIHMVPHIESLLEKFFVDNPNYVLDGELYNHELRNDFEKIVSLVRKDKTTEENLKVSEELIQYHIYDMYIDEPDWPNMFRDKIIELGEIYDHYLSESQGESYTDPSTICLVPTKSFMRKSDIEGPLREYLDMGYEGIMLRNPDSEYEKDKRSNHLLKMKEFHDEEYTISDIVEGKGKWKGYAKSIEYTMENGEIFNTGIKGNQEFCKVILENKSDYIGTSGTVKYQEKTKTGRPRFGVTIKFWGKDGKI